MYRKGVNEARDKKTDKIVLYQKQLGDTAEELENRKEFKV